MNDWKTLQQKLINTKCETDHKITVLAQNNSLRWVSNNSEDSSKIFTLQENETNLISYFILKHQKFLAEISRIEIFALWHLPYMICWYS